MVGDDIVTSLNSSNDIVPGFHFDKLPLYFNIWLFVGSGEYITSGI